MSSSNSNNIRQSKENHIIEGYKYNCYNAMYNQTTFILSLKYDTDTESCVLEVQDGNSGTTFILPLPKGEKLIYEQQIEKSRTKSKIGKWEQT